MAPSRTEIPGNLFPYVASELLKPICQKWSISFFINLFQPFQISHEFETMMYDILVFNPTFCNGFILIRKTPSFSDFLFHFFFLNRSATCFKFK